MRHRDSRDKREDNTPERQPNWTASAEALAMREVYPPEEFAGFENFGESPEWEPGQATEDLEPQNRD